MSIQLVIFDCDGVLFESEAANVAFYNEVLRRVGEPPMNPQDSGVAYAMAATQLYEHFFGERPELLETVRKVAKEVDYGPFFPLMVERPELRDVLATLRQTCKIAMATNRGMTTHQVLGRFDLDPLFDFVVGAGDVERPKPQPDMLLRCVEHFGLEPTSAIYVGDQESDAEAAAAAGMQFVGIGTAAVEGPNRIPIESLAEIPALLDSLAEPTQRSAQPQS